MFSADTQSASRTPIQGDVLHNFDTAYLDLEHSHKTTVLENDLLSIQGGADISCSQQHESSPTISVQDDIYDFDAAQFDLEIEHERATMNHSGAEVRDAATSQHFEMVTARDDPLHEAAFSEIDSNNAGSGSTLEIHSGADNSIASVSQMNEVFDFDTTEIDMEVCNSSLFGIQGNETIFNLELSPNGPALAI